MEKQNNRDIMNLRIFNKQKGKTNKLRKGVYSNNA